MLLATGVSVSVAGALPLLRFALSQFVAPAPYDTVTCRPLSVPRPPLLTVTTWPAADPMLCVATKLRAVAESAIRGCGTTNVTATLSGLFVAVGATIGTFAVYVPDAS